MDLSTILSIVQTILTAIQTLDQLKGSFSFSHTKNELERFRKTVNVVQSVLEDADSIGGALSRQQTNYIEELKDAVYEANDILKEFVTLLKQKQAIRASDKVYDKMRSFLPYYSLHIHHLSGKVKDVNNKLDDIASNSSRFMFKVGNNPVKFIKPDTSSFVSVSDPIIGRDEDLEIIVEMLLSSDDYRQSNDVSSLAIVGMGGLGKTALAQLVYNDPRITSAFPLKSWTCIADQDRQWNLTYLLGKIVGNNHNLTCLEQMYSAIRQKLEGKKYLLVLDDVWTESYRDWQELEKFLMVGQSGSRIIVTTRSKKIAQIVGDVVRVHELRGLSENDARHLFERIAIRPKQRVNRDDDFVKIGKYIVKKCYNVPIAIRVVASLLHSEPKTKWLSFLDEELTNISDIDDCMNKVLCLRARLY